MQSGRIVLLDGLLYFIVYGNLLAVYNFLYILAIFILTSNLSGNGNSLVIILFLDSKCNQTLCNLLNFFCSSLGGYNLAVV